MSDDPEDCVDFGYVRTALPVPAAIPRIPQAVIGIAQEPRPVRYVALAQNSAWELSQLCTFIRDHRRNRSACEAPTCRQLALHVGDTGIEPVTFRV